LPSHHHNKADSKGKNEIAMSEEKRLNEKPESAVVQERKESQDSAAKEQPKKKDAEKDEETGCWACLKRVLIAPPIKDSGDEVWCEL
jgi:hypothetical protein